MCNYIYIIFLDTVTKIFSWPDKAVTLLIELIGERELETKRSNIWEEIAEIMQDMKYNVTATQCSNKWSGLKRTYKNIRDENKKSGKHRTSWAFYSVIIHFI